MSLSLAAGVAGCSSRRADDVGQAYTRVLTPELKPVAWLDSGIVYFRVDLYGVGLGDSFDEVRDSSGLYLTRGDSAGVRWHSTPALTDIADRVERMSLKLGDREFVYADPDSDGRVFVLALDENRRSVLLRKCIADRYQSPAWSPSGKQIALMANCAAGANTQSLHVILAEGTGLHAVGAARDSSSESEASWSPDGLHVALTQRTRRRSDSVIVADLRSGARRTLAPGFSPSWSPLGGEIAYIRLAPAHTPGASIWLVGPDGTHDRELVPAIDPVTLRREHSDLIGPLEWSPDGRRLLFSRGQSLWTVDVVSGRQARLFYLPSWSKPY